MGITINSKILLSVASIAAAAALVIGATFAYFSDTGSSTGNVFSSGTLDMKLSDGSETDQDSVSGTWGLASASGDTFDSTLNIKNTGSVGANHVEFAFTNVVVNPTPSPGNNPTPPLDSVIEITTLAWDSDGNGSTDADLLAGVSDTNGNTIKDLDDLENQNVSGSTDFDNVTFGGPQGNDHGLRIAGRLHPTLTVNANQGDSVTMTLDVDMNQDASQ